MRRSTALFAVEFNFTSSKKVFIVNNSTHIYTVYTKTLNSTNFAFNGASNYTINAASTY